MYRVADRLDPDSYQRLARATFAEMAMAGMTAVGEFHYVHHRPGGVPYADPNAMGEAIIAAADEAGLRLTLLDTLYLGGGFDPGSPNLLAPSSSQQRFDDRTVERWADRVGRLRRGDRYRIGAAAHSVRAVDRTAIAALGVWQRETAMPVHAHVSEQPAENDACLAAHGMTPVEVFADAGLLGPGFTAVHATHLTDADIDHLGRSGSSCCLCPTTERDLGDGVGPSRSLLDAGASLCLGSDSHAVIDLFEEARAVEMDRRLVTNRRGEHTSSELLEMATASGHRSLGWDDAGVIAPGRRADLVTVRLDSVRTAGAPSADALESVLFSATATDVTHVVIDGQTVVADGNHVRIDAAAELRSSIAALLDEPVGSKP
jgi:formiminoglutamate deiminase